MSAEDAKRELAVLEADYERAKTTVDELRAKFLRLREEAADTELRHREAMVQRDALRKKGKRAAHIAEGRCRQEMRGGDTWHPTWTLCTKPAKDGFYCGIHIASRARNRPPSAVDATSDQTQ